MAIEVGAGGRVGSRVEVESRRRESGSSVGVQSRGRESGSRVGVESRRRDGDRKLALAVGLEAR